MIVNLKKMKFGWKVGLAALLFFPLAADSCNGDSSSSTANKDEKKATGDQMQILTDAQPPLQVRYSQVRQTLLIAEYLAASGAATHTFDFIEGGGDHRHPVFECDSVGFPVPGTFNITNPDQVDPDHAGSGATIGQAEGILGVYTGPTDGTYVVCLTPGDDPKPFVHWAEGHVEGGFPPGTTWSDEKQEIVLPNNSGSLITDTPVPIIPNG